MTFTLHYGEEAIEYDVVRRPDQTKPKMRIKVYPDGAVRVSVPEGTADEVIRKGVTNRARWIWTHLQDFKSQFDNVLPRTYTSGETQFYLGRRYMLKVLDGPHAEVKMRRGRLDVILGPGPELRTRQVKRLLKSWYDFRARVVFKKRLKTLLPQTDWVETIPPIKLMAMQKQWGSCTPKGTILLNPNLVKAPKDCIDYVILHELCHLAEPNHSPRFWRLLDQVLPPWKDVKTDLDNRAELYLNE